MAEAVVPPIVPVVGKDEASEPWSAEVVVALCRRPPCWTPMTRPAVAVIAALDVTEAPEARSSLLGRRTR